MNKLVEYLMKNHNPMSNAINHVSVDTIVEETDWSREEIWELSKDPEASKKLSRGYIRKDSKDFSLPSASDLVTVGIWNRLYWNGFGK